VSTPKYDKEKQAKRFVIFGDSYKISEIAKEFGMNQSTIHARIKRGMTIHEAIKAG